MTTTNAAMTPASNIGIGIDWFPTAMALCQTDTAPNKPTTLELRGQNGDFEVKFDGVRAQLMVPSTGPVLRNRNGKDITHRYPEIIDAARQFQVGTMLDGELVVFDENGRSDFQLISQRDRLTNAAKILKRSQDMPATFAAFDCMTLNGAYVTGSPLSARREMLRVTLQVAGFDQPSKDHRFIRAQVFEVTNRNQAENLWDSVVDNGLEGLVWKARDSHYRNGRIGDWYKIKAEQRVIARAASYEEGKGKHVGRIGALHLTCWDGQQWKAIGKVGTGFSDTQREQLKHMIDNGDYPIVQVAYNGVVSRSIRFPVFKGQLSVAHNIPDLSQIPELM